MTNLRTGWYWRQTWTRAHYLTRGADLTLCGVTAAGGGFVGARERQRCRHCTARVETVRQT